MNSTLHSGGCLCGAIRFEIAPPFSRMIHCHCSRCRRGTGTGHGTNLIAAPSQLRWLRGEELITRFDLPEARSYGKWFCSRCGSPQPRPTRDGKLLVVPAGALDEAPPNLPTDRIFWDSRMPWSCESGALATHAGYPENW